MKMKKLILIPLLSFLLLFNGCFLLLGYNREEQFIAEYTGEHPEIFSIAVYSILGDNAWGSKVSVEILEEDAYGRTLASYETLLDEEPDIKCRTLIICQKTEDSYAYFYPDFNFIIKPEGEEFSEEEIGNLKEGNDWGKPLNDEKMSRVKIIRDKDVDSSKGGWRGLLFEEDGVFYGTLQEDEYYTLNSLGRDKDGRTLFAFEVSSAKRNNRGIEVYKYERRYALILNPDNTAQESYLMLIEDDYNYQEQLKEFKELNDWELYAE